MSRYRVGFHVRTAKRSALVRLYVASMDHHREASAVQMLECLQGSTPWSMARHVELRVQQYALNSRLPLEKSDASLCLTEWFILKTSSTERDFFLNLKMHWHCKSLPRNPPRKYTAR